MNLENMDKSILENIIKEVITEKLSGMLSGKDFVRDNANGVISVKLDTVKTSEADRLKTGRDTDIVYTKDVLTLEESPRLGAGIMEMDKTAFDWTLKYDEIDYVIDGYLEIIKDGKKVSAGPGEMIYIPMGSSITFSVPDKARFLYVTYPANWNS